MGQGGRLCVRVHAAQAGRPRLGTVGISPGGLKGVGYGHCYARPAGPHQEGSQAWCWDEAGHTIYSSLLRLSGTETARASYLRESENGYLCGWPW